MEKMTHIDLFAGIGGFSLGFDRCGIETVAQVEIDKHCQEVLKEHWNVPLFADVRDVGAHNLPYADIITFGSPCQDLSVAGKRNGLSGERSSLFYEAIRIVREIKPRYAIWENVPGALSSNNGADFKAVIESFIEADVPMPKSGRWATAGMVRIGEKELAWRVLDSQYFGVPQRRKRIFLVFCSRGDSAAEVLFESKSMSGDFAPSKQEGEAVTSTFTVRTGTHGSGGRGYLALKDGAMTLGGQPQWVANTLAGGSSKAHSDITSGQQDMNVVIAYNIHQNDDKRKDRPSGGCGGVPSSRGEHIVAASYWDGGQVSDTPESSMLYKGQMMPEKRRMPVVTVGALQERDYKGVRTQYVNEGKVIPTDWQNPILWQMNHASEVYRENGEISPTLQERMGTGGNNVPLVSARRLTPTECERLQGFPDNFTISQSDTNRYRQLGNAVTVNVTEWIGRRICR